MPRLTVPGVLNQEYRFSDTQNDGRITQRKDWISGEEVSYQYDSLNRLISASTTGPEWGQSFSYDGFGNMLAQTVTKGTAPTLSVLVNPATNRITTAGYGYDSNGNLTSMPLLTLSYDIENRLVQATSSLNGTERYVYDPGNRRVWKEGKVYFYGVEGNLLGTYGDGTNNDYNVYFGAKLIWQEAAAGLAAHPVNADRMSSTVKHFPYGEEPTTTSQDRSKFATYYRDATTALDYAQNRYYARTIGRFTTTDPYSGSARLGNPQSWNRYAYVENDPVNFKDPSGLFWGWLFDALADAWDAMSGWGGSLFGWQRKPDLTPDYNSWTGSSDTLTGLEESGSGAENSERAVADSVAVATGNASVPTKVVATSDTYRQDPLGIFGTFYERDITYEAYSGNKPMPKDAGAIITEHLTPATPPFGELPQNISSPSKPGQPFFDEYSARGGPGFNEVQSFTVTVGRTPYPVGVQNIDGVYAPVNNVKVRPCWVNINGDKGEPPPCQ